MKNSKKDVQSPFIRYIQDLYQHEAEDSYRESTMRTVTFNFPAADACMLASIAKRFGKSTAAFGGDLFAEHVRELFIALSPEDRKSLAVEADAELTRYEESKGVKTYIDGQPTGANHWRRYADLCNEVDAKEGGSK